MYSLPEFRKLLGSTADGLSDDEVIAIRTLEYAVADLIIDRWLQERSKLQVGARR
jgi:hypothetical protein